MNKAVSPIYPIASLIPRSTLELIYCIYIRPYFDYADFVYDGNITVTDSLRLERLQNRIARLVTGTLRRTPTDKLRLELGWDSLKTRRNIHKLTLYYKLKHPQSQFPAYIRSILPNTRQQDTGRELRNANTNTLPANRLTKYQQSFVPATTRLWNSLPDHIRNEASPTPFKKSVMRHLGTPPTPPYFSSGNKIGNRIHTRLRVGLSYLNSHLYPLQLSETPQCHCGSPIETVLHFIVNCPLYHNSRNNLNRSMCNVLNIDFPALHSSEQVDLLLNGTNLPSGVDRVVAHLFQNFLLSCGRFA